MHRYIIIIFIIIIVLTFIMCHTSSTTRSGFSNPVRDAYLTELIKSDYIQSYPWMANNPNGATSYNMPLFQQSSKPPIFERHPLTYYDFGEITYIGNPL